MAILVKGKTFTSTEQVTSTKLHQLVDSATFDPAAADGSTLEVSGGALRVKDAGITGAKLSTTVAIPSGATATTQAADTNTTAVATCAFAKAEADVAQAYAIQRANHTGTQHVSTVTGLGTAATASSAQVCKAWVNFNGTGTIAIRDQYNVSSITDNGVGDYTVNFTSAMSNANYSATSTMGPMGASSGTFVAATTIGSNLGTTYGITASSTRISNVALGYNSGADPLVACLQIFSN